MQSIKVKTTAGKTVDVTTEELLTLFLHFCRQHYAEHSSEILLGENAKTDTEFIITPIKRNKNENIS